MMNKDEMLPAVVRLVKAIPQQHEDPLKQASYVNGYLTGLLNAMYDELPEVQQVIDHVLAQWENGADQANTDED